MHLEVTEFSCGCGLLLCFGSYRESAITGKTGHISLQDGEFRYPALHEGIEHRHREVDLAVAR